MVVRRSLLRTRFLQAGASAPEAESRPSFFRQFSAGHTPRWNTRYHQRPSSPSERPSSTRSSASTMSQWLKRSKVAHYQVSPSASSSAKTPTPPKAAGQWSSSRPSCSSSQFPSTTSRRGANKWVRRLPSMRGKKKAPPTADAEPSSGFVSRLRSRTKSRKNLTKQRSSSLRDLFKRREGPKP